MPTLCCWFCPGFHRSLTELSLTIWQHTWLPHRHRPIYLIETARLFRGDSLPGCTMWCHTRSPAAGSASPGTTAARAFSSSHTCNHPLHSWHISLRRWFLHCQLSHATQAAGTKFQPVLLAGTPTRQKKRWQQPTREELKGRELLPPNPPQLCGQAGAWEVPNPAGWGWTTERPERLGED